MQTRNKADMNFTGLIEEEILVDMKMSDERTTCTSSMLLEKKCGKYMQV